MGQVLQPGEAAPDFAAVVTGGLHEDGATVRLSDFAGRRLVLYFYPKDDTPGCTTQACGLRDAWEEVVATGAALYGVSVDPPASHRRFLDKHELPFPLLSDPDHLMVNAYGVWVEKSMYGRKYMGTERTTFVIGSDGRIDAVLRKVTPGSHAKLLLQALKAP